MGVKGESLAIWLIFERKACVNRVALGAPFVPWHSLRKRARPVNSENDTIARRAHAGIALSVIPKGSISFCLLALEGGSLSTERGNLKPDIPRARLAQFLSCPALAPTASA